MGYWKLLLMQILITADMAHEFLDTIRDIEPKVEAVLVNRKNTYSYTFGANIIFAKSNVVKYLAVVKYGRVEWPMKGSLFPKLFSISFFENVPEATEWLLLKLS